MPSEINSAWRRSDARLKLAASFIDATESIEIADREQVYASRILLLYSACQFAVQELGEACVRVLSSAHRVPSTLPQKVRRLHIDSSVAKLPNDKNAADWPRRAETLIGITGRHWSQYTSLSALDGNVWPDRIISYFRGFTEAEPDFTWVRDIRNSNGETLQSRLRSLVEERNPLAHGHLESKVASANFMRDWAADCSAFLSHVYISVASAIFCDLPKRTPKVGARDRSIGLGNQTAAIKIVRASVQVGDVVVLRTRSSTLARAATVVSIMAGGQALVQATEGATEVAVQLSKIIGAADLYVAP